MPDYSSDLPQLNYFENIWGILFNAFCTDEVAVVTLSVPFTNTTFTIDGHIVDYVPQSVKTVIALTAWGMTLIYILKDIRNTIAMLASFRIDNIGKDVKKEDL